jgi:hypothetical protein
MAEGEILTKGKREKDEEMLESVSVYSSKNDPRTDLYFKPQQHSGPQYRQRLSNLTFGDALQTPLMLVFVRMQAAVHCYVIDNTHRIP